MSGGPRVLVAICASLIVVSGPWSAGAPLPEPLQELHGAVLHGKAYVAGGIDSANRASARAYRYDAVANHWERIAELPGPRHHMPLAVANDTLYAIGGLLPDFTPAATLWIYLEASNTWESRAALPEASVAAP